MAGNRYTENEIILCTYIARFGRGLINEDLIRSLFDRRSVGSVKMKVKNIARMLSEEGYRHSQEVSPWGGDPRTDWHTVQPYADRSEPDFTARVKEILARTAAAETRSACIVAVGTSADDEIRNRARIRKQDPLRSLAAKRTGLRGEGHHHPLPVAEAVGAGAGSDAAGSDAEADEEDSQWRVERTQRGRSDQHVPCGRARRASVGDARDDRT